MWYHSDLVDKSRLLATAVAPGQEIQVLAGANAQKILLQEPGKRLPSSDISIAQSSRSDLNGRERPLAKCQVDPFLLVLATLVTVLF